MNRILVASVLLLFLAAPAGAQTPASEPEYLTRSTAPPPVGKAPGLKATELSPRVRIFQITFAKGDEVAAGRRRLPRRTISPPRISPPSALSIMP